MVTITNTTRSDLPQLSIDRIATAILGKEYELSLVFIGDARSQTLNKTYRNKDAPASVLSFPLEDSAGEVYLNLPYTKRRAQKAGLSERDMVAYLLIHGFLHLKGHDHGGTMDRREKQFCSQFRITYPY